MRRADIIANVLYRIGTPRLLDTMWGAERLTVLAYHRITDATTPSFPYYRKNVSASPQMFDRHLQHIVKTFNVIDLVSLKNCLFHSRPLPPRPLLITFDDGYMDNYTYAYPLLRRYNLPAVIFLTTGYIDHPMPPWWDLCAYYFHHTKLSSAALPMIGRRQLSSKQQRTIAADMLIRSLKQVCDTDKQQAMHTLADTLQVRPPTSDHELFLTWNHVRELQEHGVACQAHTITHPILTKVSFAEAYRQVVEPRTRIAHETGRVVDSFAYPNGTYDDYNGAVLSLLREAGYKTAFTMLPGPMRLADARKNPFEIRRVYIGYQDTFETFVLKVMGLTRLAAYTQWAW